MSTSAPIRLAARELVKRYGSRTVVNHLSLEVREGEVVGLLGPNGAGKTTTFHMMVGFERPDEGDILLGAENITNLPPAARDFGIGRLAALLERDFALTLEEAATGTMAEQAPPTNAGAPHKLSA